MISHFNACHVNVYIIVYSGHMLCYRDDDGNQIKSTSDRFTGCLIDKPRFYSLKTVPA